jgi:hypothetical protein
MKTKLNGASAEMLWNYSEKLKKHSAGAKRQSKLDHRKVKLACRNDDLRTEAARILLRPSWRRVVFAERLARDE